MAIYRQSRNVLECLVMEYQLVLQFTADSMQDFDRLVALETTLIAKLGKIAAVDGHDFGSGKFNIFLLTDHPDATFAEAHQIALHETIPSDLRSAYRSIGSDEYITIWPPSRTDFVL